MESHLQIRHLNVYYDRNQQALKDVNIDIPRKQITVIMGPSGCGKTTLLKSLNRFLELGDDTRISGQVLLDGEDIYAPDVDVTEVRKKTGLLAQRPTRCPCPFMTTLPMGCASTR
jgi:phosphate transport system ATP-binding protein